MDNEQEYIYKYSGAVQSLGRVRVMPKGNYNSSISYEELDLVSFGNNAYICTKPIINVAPPNPSYWQEILHGPTGQVGVVYVNDSNLPPYLQGNYLKFY